MMAKFSIPILFIIILLILSLLSSPAAAGEDPTGSFVRSLDLKKEKFSHISLYWHNIFSGKNPSAATVVQPVNTSTTDFGRFTVFDDHLTVGPNLSSNMVGLAQGFYALTSQEEVALLIIMNLVFTEGKYNGSTITLLGRIAIIGEENEIPVIGGSGRFRFAIGYAKLTTYSLSLVTRDVTVEYNVYVKHYEVR